MTRWPEHLSAVAVALAREGIGPARSAQVLNARFGCEHTSDSVAGHLKRIARRPSDEEQIARALAPFAVPESRMEAVKESTQKLANERSVAAPPQQAAPTVTVQRPLPTQGAASNVSGLIAILADIHAPDYDERTMAAFEAWARDARPDEIIIAGDFWEFESASQHPGTAPRMYEDDLAEGRALARRLLALAPVTLRPGNHDKRPERMIQNRAPTMAGGLDPLETLAEMGVRIDRGGFQPMRRHRAKILHGHEMLTGRFPPKYHVQRAFERYAEPGTIIVYGHVHYAQGDVRAMDTGVCRAQSLPCMRTLRADWQGDEVSRWENGFGVLSGGEELTVVRIAEGRCWWGGRQYAA